MLKKKVAATISPIIHYCPKCGLPNLLTQEIIKTATKTKLISLKCKCGETFDVTQTN